MHEASTEDAPIESKSPRASHWHGEAGVAEVLKIALPLMVSSLSWTVMNFIDRLMLTDYSTDALAAALPAGALFWAVVCLPFGIASYVNTFVSQYLGVGKSERIGLAVWQGIFLLAFTWPVMLITAPLMAMSFAAFGHSAEIASLEATYYQINTLSGGALIMVASLSSFYTGRGNSNIVMVVDTFSAMVNVALDYAWIYGHWGFPEGGIAGAAWATVVALWVKCFIYLALFLRADNRQRFGTWSGCRFDQRLFVRLMRFGGLNGLQMVVEISGFTVFLLLIGQLGKLELAASSLALNLNNLAFMPAWGISTATSAIVGRYLGQGRDDLAVRGTWSSMFIAGSYMLVISALYWFAPDLVMMAHQSLKEDSQGFDSVREMTVVLLRFAASFGMLDAMSLVFSGALKGAGDTGFILRVNLVLATVPVLLTWIGHAYFGLGIYWAWSMLSLWVACLGVAFGLRFWQGRWRHMRVIETHDGGR